MRDCVAISPIRSRHRFISCCLPCVLAPALSLSTGAGSGSLCPLHPLSLRVSCPHGAAGQATAASHPRRIMLVAHREGIRELSRVAEGAAITNTPYCCVGVFRYSRGGYSRGGALPAHGTQASQLAQTASQAGALP